MQVLKTLDELRAFQGALNGQSLGFVPTMGALHEGHLSLVRQSMARADRTLCSIYVNPTQFNNAEDLAKYPNTLEDDIEALASIGCDAVYLPTADQLYPDGLKSRSFDFQCLDLAMEGAGRPGHFEGMATVVTKFFELVKPQFAFFGEKDYQQLCIVKHVVQKEGWGVEIVPGAIVRESDGLAMSSRNLRLSESERKDAAQIHAVLRQAIEGMDLELCTPESWAEACRKKIDAVPSLTTEYIVCADQAKLQPIEFFDPEVPTRVFAAVQCGKVRLIDNLPLF